MKDELLKYLNIKLKYIDDNIETLENMNEKLQEESKSLDYYERSLNLFNNADGNCDIYKFDQMDKDNFEKILAKLSDDVKNQFNNVGCNYDGLVYLINGINSGISLKLTDDQVNAINSFIDGISFLKIEHLAHIDGIVLAKSKLDIDDIDILNNHKDKYETIVENLMSDEYLKDIDEINDALDFSNVSLEKKVEVYEYILKNNADIFEKVKVKEDVKEEKVNIEKEEIEEPKEEVTVEKEELKEESFNVSIDTGDDFDIDVDDDFKAFTLPQVDGISFDDVKEETVDVSDEVNEELDLPTFDEEEKKEEPVENDLDDLDLPLADEEIEMPETTNDVSNSVKEELPVVDEDFKDIDDGNSYEEEPVNDSLQVASNLTISQVDELLSKYGVKNLSVEDKNLLLNGDINNYEEILSLLSEKKYLDDFTKNNILSETLLYSSKDALNNVFDLVKEHLSVDDDDYKVTLEIVIKTMPLVFTLEPNGLYNTFVRNINLLKGFNIDLINLFDASREVFVCDSSVLVNNYNIVSSYGIKVNENNAKYLLMLSNIGEKIDYFVESVYKDSITGNVFDGSELVNLYPVKLNNVKDLTIKRLRYSSETGKKIFGSKEKSLTGEITNLKVDVINMPVDYVKSFFNNEFDVLTNEEINSYMNIINKDNSFDMEMDSLLNKLETYSNGIRYVINNIYISKNKVIRIYNVLKKNGITGNKALLFSVCYNLVITKDEYKALSNTIQSLGDE